MSQAVCFLSDLLRAVARIAPPELAEGWDNVGLQVGHPAAPVRRVMTCLELTEPTLAEAIERKADAVVAHHPLIFKPLTALNLAQPGGALVGELVKAGIALVAAHTNLDAAAWSTNHVLAETCGLTVEEPLAARMLTRATTQPAAEGETPVGLGLVARPATPTTAEAFAAHVKEAMGLTGVRLSGPADKKIKRVAVCSGSGGALLGLAAGRAEALLTGEINYHHGVEAHQRRIAVIEVGHFESEAIVASPLAERLAADEKLREGGVEVFAAERDFQPFRNA
jgi:dinuclear metal center YbgI/SA1388 family protein